MLRLAVVMGAVLAVLRILRERCRRWMLLVFISFWVAIFTSGGFTTMPAAANSEIAAGIAAYESGQFSAAIAQWQAALAGSEGLSQAYLLSNLAAAYRQLAQSEAAQTALSQSLEIIQNWPQQDLAYWEVSARVLNTQGQSQWQQGKTQQALATWQAAEEHYRRSENADQAGSGRVISKINQALALQELGFNAQAVEQLSELNMQISALEPSLRLSASRELGKALRGVGELSTAKSVLSAQLANAAGIERQQVQLELGHTARSLSHRAIAIGKLAAARDYASEAIAAYTAAQNPVSNRLLHTQAQLNQLSYLIETGQLETARTFWPTISLDNLPPGRVSVEAHISYAHSLACLQSPLSVTCIRQEWQDEIAAPAAFSGVPKADKPLWKAITAQLSTAISQAQALADPLLASYAFGELGHAYELTGQWDEAIDLTEQALMLVEGRAVPDVAYRWEWQLGRLYWQLAQQRSRAEDLGRSPWETQAVSAYQQALTSLAAVRQNLLLIDPQVQFSFRDNVEPIYREFVSLLLNPGAVSKNRQLDQQSLKLAVQTLDALQVTELENFLGCNLSELVNLNESTQDTQAVKIYPIILPDQLAIIFDLPNQPLAFRSIPVAQLEIERTIKSLRNNLTLPGQTPAVLTDARQVYQWLIAPLESVLAKNPQIETLVFVPDGLLRNIPMGVLYDGEQYLIEKDYALAIAPQLNLFAPRTSPQRLRVLRGGIGLPQTIRGQRFPPIELIQAELDQIPEVLTVAPPLLNENFTQANIEQQLAAKRYSAIHWKTHGVFSSTPAETFLVAYQDGITANELSSLVQSASQRQAEPLELLVLSACETAQGDRRAVLGLAGIAVRAGTRSTLSTLWRADDGANTQLMAYFYQGLTEGLSKAQALQKAQQALLTIEGYPAPYYWASYVLVGNWL